MTIDTSTESILLKARF